MIDFYYYLLDKKIKNWSLLILIIIVLIVSAGIMFGSDKYNTKASTVEYKKSISTDLNKIKFED